MSALLKSFESEPLEKIVGFRHIFEIRVLILLLRMQSVYSKFPSAILIIYIIILFQVIDIDNLLKQR